MPMNCKWEKIICDSGLCFFSIAQRQGMKRGWFTYTDLCVLLEQSVWSQALTAIYQHFTKVRRRFERELSGYLSGRIQRDYTDTNFKLLRVKDTCVLGLLICFDPFYFSGILYAWPGLSNQCGRPYCHQCCAAPAQSLKKRPVPAYTANWVEPYPRPDLQHNPRCSCSIPAPPLLCSGQQKSKPSDQYTWTWTTRKKRCPFSYLTIGINIVSLRFFTCLSGSHTSWKIWNGNFPSLVCCLFPLSWLSCNPPSSSVRT